MRFKLNLLLFLVVTVVLLGSSMISFFSLRADLTESYESRKQDLAKRLQVNLAKPRDRLTLADDAEYIRCRAAIIEFLYKKQVKKDH